MTEYMTEQEQIEQLKAWLKQYGMTIVSGIALALVIVSGWHYWQNATNRKLTKASMVYEQMMNSRSHNLTPEVRLKATKLIQRYPRTPYAPLAALMLARDAVNTKNYDEALKQLHWVIDHSKVAALREIAKIRNAKILLAKNQSDQALDVLSSAADKNFQSLIDEVRGDVFYQKNDLSKAKEAYQLALQELPKGETSETPLLQMKLDNLATSADIASQ